MAQRTIWMQWDGPSTGGLNLYLYGPLPQAQVPTGRGFAVPITYDTDYYADSDITNAYTAIYGMLPCDPIDSAPVRPLILRQAPLHSQLTSAGSAIPNASGWQDVVSQAMTVSAGATIEIDWWFFGNMPALLLGGQVRAVVNGGTYTNHVVQASLDLPLLATASHLAGPALFTPNAAGTYTLSLQGQATVALGSLTPQPGCALRLRELGPQV
jgi:hypothetical protein